MPTTTEKPDCVAMKDRIQAQVLREFEARKREFSSFADFLKATESGWERGIRLRLVRDPRQAR